MTSNELARVTVIVPSYNPDEKLKQVVEGLVSVGFSDILIINDGSKEECLCRFQEASKAGIGSVTVLTHEMNKGKGAGLKTAFRFIAENRKDSIGCVAVDGDNQHRPEDALRCAEEMAEKQTFVLGVRNFDLPQVPPRSKFGNKLTSFVFKTGVGLNISDTQTGLRAFPAKYYGIFTETRGDRYEYEINQLLDLKANGIPFSEVEIETVYIEENQTSHFHPVRDSIRIYSQIFRFMMSSVISWIVDIGLFRIFLAVFAFIGNAAAKTTVSTALARVISSVVNFVLNKKMVFRNGDGVGKTLLRYYCLAVPQFLVSALLVSGIDKLIGAGNDWITTLIKIVVDTVLYFISYGIQRNWVFAKKTEE